MGGVVLNVIDETTGNIVLQASGDLDTIALEIADVMLTGLRPGTKTKTEMAPVKAKGPRPEGGVVLNDIDDGGYESYDERKVSG